MSDQPPSAAVRPRSRVLAIGSVLVGILVVAGWVLGISIHNYINRTIADGIAAAVPAAVVMAVKTDPQFALAIENRVRSSAAALIRQHPEQIAESLNRYLEKQRTDAVQKEDAALQGYTATMLDPAGLPVAGPADAAVTVGYFFDAACPYCKQMDPFLDELAASGAARVIYREIPILGPASDRAARLSAAAWAAVPDKWQRFHEHLMSAKGRLDDATIDRTAMETFGAEDAVKIAAAAVADKDRAISGRLSGNLDLAKAAGVQGTPFIVLSDGTFFRGAVPKEQLTAAVDKARQKKSAN